MGKQPRQLAAIVAFIGPKYSGKSMLIDRLFESICQTRGHAFSKLGATAGSWLGGIPIASERVSVYLMDCEGIDDLSDKNQQDLLRFVYSICSTIVLNIRSRNDRY